MSTDITKTLAGKAALEVRKWEIAEPRDTNLRRMTTSGRGLARSYDYVIVGAGSAGCVVARRLLDCTEATVLLLEAGGPGDDVASLLNPLQWVENLGSPYDWAYRYEPSPHVAHRAIPLSLGKVLGGSGLINA